MSKFGVFARSHATPTTSPWTTDWRMFWQNVKGDLGNLEIFLENLYAVHSIEYTALDSYYYVFAVRESGCWLGWEEVRFYAAMLDLPTVPELANEITPTDQKKFEQKIGSMVQRPGALMPIDAATGLPTTMEGIVSRNASAFSVDAFEHNVFKWVRKDHVQTSEHWTRAWKKAQLKGKGGRYVDIR